MKRTAYFHPAFAEELALLTPDARIHFYSLALRDAMSFTNRDRYCTYKPEDDSGTAVRMLFKIRYFQVTPIPKTCMAIDPATMPDANLYLHMAVHPADLDKTTFDRELILKSKARLKELKDNVFDPLSFDDFCEAHADETEVKEARRINIDMGEQDFYRSVMILAFEDAQREIGHLFNLSPMQMTRMLKRFDRFLECFNHCLDKRWGGRVALHVNYRSDALFAERSFHELTATKMNEDFEPRMDSE